MKAQSYEPVHGAHALFVFHLALFSWWAFVQVIYHVVLRFVKADPALLVDSVNLGLTVAAVVVTLRFAEGARGTAAESAARFVVGFALVDLVADLLQFAPRLGLPEIIPSDKSSTELLVRCVWVACEFSLRSATFVTLRRAQAGVDARLALAFFALIGLNCVTTAVSFARSSGSATAYWNAQPFAARLVQISPLVSLAWLTILVFLSWRLAFGQRSTSGAPA
jgi:hypothetical protein